MDRELRDRLDLGISQVLTRLESERAMQMAEAAELRCCCELAMSREVSHDGSVQTVKEDFEAALVKLGLLESTVQDHELLQRQQLKDFSALKLSFEAVERNLSQNPAESPSGLLKMEKRVEVLEAAAARWERIEFQESRVEAVERQLLRTLSLISPELQASNSLPDVQDMSRCSFECYRISECSGSQSEGTEHSDLEEVRRILVPEKPNTVRSPELPLKDEGLVWQDDTQRLVGIHDEVFPSALVEMPRVEPAQTIKLRHTVIREMDAQVAKLGRQEEVPIYVPDPEGVACVEVNPRSPERVRSSTSPVHVEETPVSPLTRSLTAPSAPVHKDTTVVYMGSAVSFPGPEVSPRVVDVSAVREAAQEKIKMFNHPEIPRLTRATLRYTPSRHQSAGASERLLKSPRRGGSSVSIPLSKATPTPANTSVNSPRGSPTPEQRRSLSPRHTATTCSSPRLGSSVSVPLTQSQTPRLVKCSAVGRSPGKVGNHSPAPSLASPSRSCGKPLCRRTFPLRSNEVACQLFDHLSRSETRPFL
uniref:Uncharacterized protein n=1 Tax=Noctiluca scintillans TaxID=2966 RepID=A0A7S1AHY7_NOCSC